MKSYIKPFKSRFIIFCFLLFFFTITSTSSYSAIFDLTPFYRSTLFQGFPKADQRDWTTHFEVKYSEGSTHHSYTKNENLTTLFNAQGPFELADLGTNLEGLTEESKPLTWLYLRDLEGDLGDMTALGKDSTTGQFQFDGKLFTRQLDFLIQQNIFSGFYLQLLLPIRKIRVHDIMFIHRGEEPIGNDKITFNNFLNDLDDILSENDLLPLTSDYRQDSISDIVVSAGWHGYSRNVSNIVDALQGFIQIGVLIPSGKRQNLKRVFSIPIGYNQLWGVHSRFVLQANAFEFIAFGIQGGITTFFDRTKNLRLKTSEAQNGWIVFERSRAQIEKGAVWDLGGYIKIDHIRGGFSFLGGYTFSKGERTHLTVKDPDYLKTFVKDQKLLNPPVIISRDKIANSDKRLGIWKQQVVHALVQYDFKVHFDSLFAPQIEFSYHFPFLGKFIMPTEMFSGRLGLSFHWDID